MNANEVMRLALEVIGGADEEPVTDVELCALMARKALKTAQGLDEGLLSSKLDKLFETYKPNYLEYKQFFETCFEYLGEEYVAPDVTRAEDCNVIFKAILKGDDV